MHPIATLLLGGEIKVFKTDQAQLYKFISFWLPKHYLGASAP